MTKIKMAKIKRKKQIKIEYNLCINKTQIIYKLYNMLKKRMSNAKTYADRVERDAKTRITGISNNKILHKTYVIPYSKKEPSNNANVD